MYKNDSNTDNLNTNFEHLALNSANEPGPSLHMENEMLCLMNMKYVESCKILSFKSR